MGGSESKGREENGENMESRTSALAKGAAILTLGAVGVSLMVSSFKSREEETMEDTDRRKTMKRPGRDGRMPRDDFEKDPSGYFKKLHSDERKEKSLANK